MVVRRVMRIEGRRRRLRDVKALVSCGAAFFEVDLSRAKEG